MMGRSQISQIKNQSTVQMCTRAVQTGPDWGTPLTITVLLMLPWTTQNRSGGRMPRFDGSRCMTISLLLLMATET